jgi:type VI secretion system protein ImpF
VAAIDPNKKLHAPLLDRLFDDDPLNTTEQNSLNNHQLVRQFKESVRRDLEKLFNSRYRCISPPAEFKHLEKSLLNYGLPDVATLGLESSKAKKAFCKEIEKTILRYEPRIRSVTVTTPSSFDPEDPSIRFRVEAVLHALPAEERIVFDSALNPVTRSVDVSESRI